MCIWCLILYVSLTRLRHSQVAGKTLFVGVSGCIWWGCFWKMLVFESVHWVCKDLPYQCRWTASNPSRAWIKQKGEQKENSFSVWAETSYSPALDHWLLDSYQDLDHWPPILRPLNLNWMTRLVLYLVLFWFFILQMADCGTSLHSKPCESIPVCLSVSLPHLSLSISISLYIYLLWVCFSGEPWQIYRSYWRNVLWWTQSLLGS